jgi:hypothetical protein
MTLQAASPCCVAFNSHDLSVCFGTELTSHKMTPGVSCEQVKEAEQDEGNHERAHGNNRTSRVGKGQTPHLSDGQEPDKTTKNETCDQINKVVTASRPFSDKHDQQDAQCRDGHCPGL